MGGQEKEKKNYWSNKIKCVLICRSVLRALLLPVFVETMRNRIYLSERDEKGEGVNTVGGIW